MAPRAWSATVIDLSFNDPPPGTRVASEEPPQAALSTEIFAVSRWLAAIRDQYVGLLFLA
jgi:hypothetical protein